jgi:hypothetical protein
MASAVKHLENTLRHNQTKTTKQTVFINTTTSIGNPFKSRTLSNLFIAL